MKKYYLIICLLISITLLSCRGSSSLKSDEGNSIYYWRTTFSLSDKENEFLKEHEVKKIYMRFFDVNRTYSDIDNEDVIPEATIRFNDTVPNDIDVVPTIYITTSAIEKMQTKEMEYAEKIYKRVTAIGKKNNITIKEIQLDCDWTKGTRQPFFRLCEAMKEYMDSTQELSSTIRLHQLTQTPPPVDKGVLMVYNTGNLMEMTSDNSIFSRKDIEPYLRDNRLALYPLPLDVAYPAYGWSVVFRPEKDKYYFDRIMRRTDFSCFPPLHKIASNLYEATSEVIFYEDNTKSDYVFEKYRIRVERPSAKEILEIKNLIDNQLKTKKHNNLLYHLDESQLSHYSNNEISKIYSRN
ncbi:MAG: hypothetical protein K2H32_10155 [Muribaculaceae bacterium]|nr:hypothetical protein [Muribaculaceae bacterium]